MNEINLPQNTVIALCVILGLLAIYLWRHLGAYQLHTEPKKSAEGNYTLDLLMPIMGLIFKHRASIITRECRMTTNKNFDLAQSRAENFGQFLNEAFQTMLDFSLENKFDHYSIEERNQLERVLEVLTDFSDMWEKGQIIVSSKEREAIK